MLPPLSQTHSYVCLRTSYVMFFALPSSCSINVFFLLFLCSLYKQQHDVIGICPIGVNGYAVVLFNFNLNINHSSVM
jgi:hypothetical protein